MSDENEEPVRPADLSRNRAARAAHGRVLGELCGVGRQASGPRRLSSAARSPLSISTPCFCPPSQERVLFVQGLPVVGRNIATTTRGQRCPLKGSTLYGLLRLREADRLI